MRDLPRDQNVRRKALFLLLALIRHVISVQHKVLDPQQRALDEFASRILGDAVAGQEADDAHLQSNSLGQPLRRTGELRGTHSVQRRLPPVDDLASTAQLLGARPTRLGAISELFAHVTAVSPGGRGWQGAASACDARAMPRWCAGPGRC